MSVDDQQESLSFLDVLTNGMGSLLVLFALMAALRATEDLGDSDVLALADPGKEGQSSAVKPFVLVVSAHAGQALSNKAPDWRIEGDPLFNKNAKRGGSVNLAFLYAESQPEPGCRIALAGLTAETQVTIHIFRDKALHASTSTKTTMTGSLALWPVQKKGNEP